ncbi:hypothetical protein RRG08_054198 [Elysia crispata]|uniref:TM7S3/TM198-like domain-containing protein n=1 Tax=Elysia crispata TaxID=231223 RepID=A0AAE1A2G5_9GAST|nr:hypothetical protein RRG08_054198 [Elysia crispata]
MIKVGVSAFSFCVGAICLLCLHNCAESANFEILVEKTYTITLPANETSSLETRGLKIERARFVVVQVHSQRKTLFLSSQNDFNADFTKKGKNVGLLYTDDEPVPGGCNQVFNLELDPSIVVDHMRPYRSRVFFQWANQAAPQGEKLPGCEDSQIVDNLEYEVYIYFMQERDLGEDEFLRAISKMLRPEDLEEHGTKIFSVTNGPTSKSQVSVSSRKAQGVVYSVLVKRKDTGHSSSYTAVASYSCNIDAGQCSLELSVLRIIGAIILGVVGLFLLLFGHRYFRATQVVFGFIFSSLLTYIAIYHAQTHDWVCLLLAVLVGAIGGGLWLAVWQRFNFPTGQVFLMGLCSGYLVAAVIFFTPFGNINWWTAVVNYALCFVCFDLLFAVFFMAFPKFLSIMSCGIVGAMMVLWSVAIPLWASLEMIFLNTIYHQTEDGYNEVKVIYPLNTQDIVLYALWPALAILGMGLQFFRESGNAGFSKPFETLRKHVLEPNELPQPGFSERNAYLYDDEDAEEERYNVSDSNSSSFRGGNNETSRLLPQSSQQASVYRSVHSRTQPTAPVASSEKK